MIAGEHRLALPSGFQLGKYRFQEVLGAGGFGITYLAEDDSLGRRVAIKELLPNDIATRLDGSTVVAKTKSEEDNLAWARDRFLKEGRALAACEHPNVVHVYEMVEANGTAYMVTKFEEGRSFAEWLRALNGPPQEKELRAILAPLLSGLDKVHKAGFLHRDLKPENIYITSDGRPILLDFGSARQALTDRTTSMTSIVTAGYAPFEQYHEDGKQGAWTDLYAMAAVMYRAIHGKKPPEATRRLQDDPCLKLSREYAGKYSTPFLQAIDKALAVEPTKRPQTVAEWRQMLGNAPIEQKIVADPKRPWDAARVQEWMRGNPMYAAGAVAAALIVILGAWRILTPSPKPIAQAAESATPPAAATPDPAPPVPQPPIAIVPPKPPLEPPTPPVFVPPPKVDPAADTAKKVDPIPGTETAPPGKGPRIGERWTNSLGQVFAGVPGIPLHMAVWETRRSDFEAFVRATGYDATAGTLSPAAKGWKATGASWVNPGFPQTPAHPVVGVNAYDALEFCRWLTGKDRAAGLIDERLVYRLPTDGEWRKASQDWKFSWGEAWPPSVGAGNYAGEEAKAALGSNRIITGYRDGFAGTSPVGTFQGNAAGFFDLGGNANEICGSWLAQNGGAAFGRQNTTQNDGPMLVLRGGSWMTSNQDALTLDARDAMHPQERYVTVGFRCVLAPVSDKEELVLPPLQLASPDVPPAIPANGEVVEKRLVGVWESKTTTPAGTVTWRWVQQVDGAYAITGPFPDSGRLTANAGHIQQVSDATGIKVALSYRFKTTTQLTTSGPLGEAAWRRIGAVPKAGDLAKVSPEDSGNDPEDRPEGSRTPSRPQSQPRPRPVEKSFESKAKDFGNSLRRRFGF